MNASAGEAPSFEKLKGYLVSDDYALKTAAPFTQNISNYYAAMLVRRGRRKRILCLATSRRKFSIQ
jgi:hypothetical protein